jgi:hypothetical protein
VRAQRTTLSPFDEITRGVHGPVPRSLSPFGFWVTAPQLVSPAAW